MLLGPQPSPNRISRVTVPHRDDESHTEEHVELAELDLPGRCVEPRRPVDDQMEAVVAFDLRALMLDRRVLDRKLVQAELDTHLFHDVRPRVVELDPDKAATMPWQRRCLGERHRLEWLVLSPT